MWDRGTTPMTPWLSGDKALAAQDWALKMVDCPSAGHGGNVFFMYLTDEVFSGYQSSPSYITSSLNKTQPKDSVPSPPLEVYGDRQHRVQDFSHRRKFRLEYQRPLYTSFTNSLKQKWWFGLGLSDLTNKNTSSLLFLYIWISVTGYFFNRSIFQALH